VRRLHAGGLGTRAIARRLKVSRSLIFRILSGDRPERGLAPRPSGSPRGVWSAQQRETAHLFLRLVRGSSTDDEFAAAERDLDRRLDRCADSTPSRLAAEVGEALTKRVRARQDAEWHAKREAERRLDSAHDDFDARWEADSKCISRDIARLQFLQRSKAEEALDEERERSRSLVERRLKTWDRGEPTEELIDRLVREGLERAARSVAKAE
jgi:hypothetical protein